MMAIVKHNVRALPGKFKSNFPSYAGIHSRDQNSLFRLIFEHIPSFVSPFCFSSWGNHADFGGCAP